jgi:flagellar biosynthesis protein FlhB
MLEAVATADVVVTNPTHYAVALKYERGKDGAPVVLAKGENRFALRIKALAAEHGVPVVENKPVARMLYSIGEVGEAIPTALSGRRRDSGVRLPHAPPVLPRTENAPRRGRKPPHCAP